MPRWVGRGLGGVYPIIVAQQMEHEFCPNPNPHLPMCARCAQERQERRLLPACVPCLLIGAMEPAQVCALCLPSAQIVPCVCVLKPVPLEMGANYVPCVPLW